MTVIDRDRLKAGTFVDQIMQQVRNRIASRQIPAGARLPSIRGMAESLQVSKSTVVDAYDRLAAEGIILSRRGSGFYVAGHPPPFSLSNAAPDLDREVDPIWMTRQSLDAENQLLKPGCGWLPAAWMPEPDIRRGLRLLARDANAALTNYSTPHGLPELRQVLSRRLGDRGIETSAHQIMLTESGTHAIDLLCRYLVEPGDTVLLDDPCYFNFHAMLRAHRVKVVGVPYTANGPDLDIFDKVLTEFAPRLYITNSALHNPTGATLSPVVAHRVLKLAETHDLLIIEDDIFADFEHQPAPRLAAFDGLDRVIQIGSFSKTLSAAIRCGYIAARSDWIEELVDLKLATSFGGGSFAAELVLSLLTDGTYRKHLNALRERLAIAMEQAGTNLKTCGLTPFIEPEAGMFLWCRLPDGLDAADVARKALAHKVVLAPGNAFSLAQSSRGFLRFNVAQTLHPRIFTVLERAME